MKQNTTTPYEIINWVADAPLKPGPKSVLLALVRYVQLSKNGNRVWPGQELIAEKAQVSLRCVNGHIKKLDRLGYISVCKRDKKDGYRQPNAYLLHFGFCHSDGDEKVSKSAYGHTQKTTKTLSKTSHEGDIEKELDIEKKVEDLKVCTASKIPCDSNPEYKKQNSGNIEDKVGVFPESSEDSFALGFYQWTDSDSTAARAFVWHDLFADAVKG